MLRVKEELVVSARYLKFALRVLDGETREQERAKGFKIKCSLFQHTCHSCKLLSFGLFLNVPGEN
jgi:hypothetical protein